jgi:hypothetical protein
MSRRHRKSLRKKHVSDLYDQAIRGCSDALKVLIELQQSGRALRFYPTGRSSPEQEGMVAVNLRTRGHHVIARSGQPQYPMLFSRDTANVWIVGMATMMHTAVHLYAGDDRELACWGSYQKKCTPDFEIKVDPSPCGERLICTIDPAGASEWVIPIRGAQSFITQALVAAESVGWTLSASKQELTTIKAYTGGELIGAWQTD